MRSFWNSFIWHPPVRRVKVPLNTHRTKEMRLNEKFGRKFEIIYGKEKGLTPQCQPREFDYSSTGSDILNIYHIQFVDDRKQDS